VTNQLITGFILERLTNNVYKLINSTLIMISIEKQSKPLSEVKKGDKIWIHGKEMQVDSHYLFQDHKTTKERIIEVFNPENNRDYQVRYFDDQIESSLEVYELVGDFQYVRKEPKSIAW
jgi:hypothetical protein